MQQETNVAAVEKQLDFTTSDNVKLYARSHTVSEARANVVLCHGYAEHSGRYEHVIRHLNQHGYNVYSFDMRNHGKSPGEKGYIHDIDRNIQDFDELVKLSKREHPNLPTDLLGHSTGGGIVLASLIKNPDRDIARVVVTGPTVIMPVPPMLNWLPTTIANFLLNYVTPIVAWFKPDLETDDAAPIHELTNNKDIQEQVKNDPLMFKGKVKVITGSEILRLAKFIRDNITKITTPIQVMVGGEDTICDPTGASFVLINVSTKDKQTITFEGDKHEIFNERRYEYSELGRDALQSTTEWFRLPPLEERKASTANDKWFKKVKSITPKLNSGEKERESNDSASTPVDATAKPTSLKPS